MQSFSSGNLTVWEISLHSPNDRKFLENIIILAIIQLVKTIHTLTENVKW